jgi:ribonuclease P protein component
VPANSFKRGRRIDDAGLFAELLKKGNRVSAGSLQAKFLPSSDTGQLGLGIAKRHLKRAVDRNRVKRIVREAYRQGPSGLKTVNIAVLLNRAPANIRSSAGRRLLARDIARLFARTAEGPADA